ncbi:EamA family transporter [Comamonas aquatica]|uniref:EamA family transporter n=1 Tax=Comamonas aquatica TaxID=225991 RepID=UPI002449B0E3|nr:EamA family transporter [Comamonas aquatica]MDH0381032.1 EamA family transporter [Comamonas aquatica]MDH0429250.1 EamA family transporter [Comamonas aquatica]MDH0940840.1 EamA family transporter [Comamonas aquatica]
MSLQAFALILLAGLIHAGWNIAAKKAGGDARFAFFSSLLLVVVWAPLAWWVGHDVVPHWGWQAWALVAVSGVLHLAYYVILLRGYRHADLTVVYPLARGSGPLISSLFAIVVLGEEISQLGQLGVAGVVLGVFLIAGGPGLLRARQDPVARLRLHQGLLYGLLTGVFIAAYTVVDGYGVKVLLLSPVVLRNLPEARSLWMVQWRWALLVAVVSPVAYVLVLFAMQSAPISHVAPAREVSMLFAALIGGHLLREGDRLVRMGGAVLIALGVTALGLG